MNPARIDPTTWRCRHCGGRERYKGQGQCIECQRLRMRVARDGQRRIGPQGVLSVYDRFERYVVRQDGCWSWSGARDADGYGIVSMQKHRVARAPRVSWEIHKGPIPSGIFVLHRCDNPPCTNPLHLFLGTPKDNMQDAVRKGRNRITHHKGEKHGRAKVTTEQVIEIRRRYAAGDVSQTTLAAEFGITQSACSLIILRKKWKHIPEIKDAL